MPAMKAKRLRLIDILGNVQEGEIVRVISPQHRLDVMRTSGEVEANYSKILGSLIEGITVERNILTIYLS